MPKNSPAEVFSKSRGQEADNKHEDVRYKALNDVLGHKESSNDKEEKWKRKPGCMEDSGEEQHFDEVFQVEDLLLHNK